MYNRIEVKNKRTNSVYRPLNGDAKQFVTEIENIG